MLKLNSKLLLGLVLPFLVNGSLAQTNICAANLTIVNNSATVISVFQASQPIVPGLYSVRVRYDDGVDAFGNQIIVDKIYPNSNVTVGGNDYSITLSGPPALPADASTRDIFWLDIGNLYFSYFNFGQCRIALPIRFKNVYTSYSSGQVTIGWTILAGSNSSSFVVEKSTNGCYWQSIGTVYPVANPSGDVNYTFVDVTPYQNSQYRIKFIDLDGLVTYSPIQFVPCSSCPTGNITRPPLSVFSSYTTSGTSRYYTLEVTPLPGTSASSYNWTIHQQNYGTGLSKSFWVNCNSTTNYKVAINLGGCDSAQKIGSVFNSNSCTNPCGGGGGGTPQYKLSPVPANTALVVAKARPCPQAAATTSALTPSSSSSANTKSDIRIYNQYGILKKSINNVDLNTDYKINTTDLQVGLYNMLIMKKGVVIESQLFNVER